jgi:predicted nucleic acid-binding protein
MARKKPTAVMFVLDGSVSLAWYFKDEADQYADSVAARLASACAAAPVIWPLEIANAVLVGERRRRSTVAQAAKWLAYMESLPIAIDEQATSRVWTAVLDLARIHELSI